MADAAPPKVYLSPEMVADRQPAEDAPRYGMCKADTLMVMRIPPQGYVVIRTHKGPGAPTAGICIFTEGDVANGL